MARLGDKSKLLELLAETPIVSFACKKVGLDRTTYYRWYKDDIDFRNQADNILSIGRIKINDMAESVIIKKINADDTRCSIFWLEHNEPRYKPVRTTYMDPITHKHELTPGEICRACGFREPPIEEYIKNKEKLMDNETLARELRQRLKIVGNKKKNEGEIMRIIEDFIKQKNLRNEIIFKDFGKNKTATNMFEVNVIDGKKKDEGKDKLEKIDRVDWVIIDGKEERKIDINNNKNNENLDDIKT